MKYFLDENNNRWAFEDEDDQLTIDNIAVGQGVTLTSVSETAFKAALVVSLSDLVSVKINDIESAFDVAELLPVNYMGFEWNGGYMAMLKYKAEYDLSDLAGLDGVDFKDTSNVRHTLSLVDAKAVLIAIGTDYHNKDITRDDYIAKARAASTQDDLDAISISFIVEK